MMNPVDPTAILARAEGLLTGRYEPTFSMVCAMLRELVACVTALHAERETYAQGYTLQALKNIGADVECGACMEVAFTGVTLSPHDCTRAAAQDAEIARLREEVTRNHRT